uniref:B30.2/SPRY domain-containing protein n=1 Tax=Latimeria chalumnae TaxID=7897 RepID=H3A1Q5_LATCH
TSQSACYNDHTSVTFDAATAHKNLLISEDQTSLRLTSDPQNVPDNPMRFDKVCSILASRSLSTGKHYMEVDVRACSVWSIGIAYGSMDRKGKLKSTTLGRNRSSWCIEQRDNHLLAWHNDTNISCGKKPSKLQRIGVHVNCERSTVAFYDAESMKLLQEFSRATATLFDRMRHHFTEPVFLAFRLFFSSSVPFSEKL